MNYEPPDEVIRKNSAAANHHRNCDFELIIHVDGLQEATVWFQRSRNYRQSNCYACNVGYWNCFDEHTQELLDFVVELRNLERGRLDRHAQVERMCQLTAHRCSSDARSRASHSSAATERVIAGFLFLIAFISIGEATIAIKYRQITEPIVLRIILVTA